MPPILRSELLFFQILLLLTASCGISIKSDQNRDDETLQLPSNTFVQYDLEDEACQRSSATVRLSPVFETYVWNGDKAVLREHEGAGIYSTSSLSSRSVARAIYGLYTKETCELQDGSFICLDKPEIIQHSSDLRLCRPNGDYRRQSIEGIALGSLRNIEIAYDYYRSLNDASAQIPRLVLMLLPKVEKIYHLPGTGTEDEKSFVVANNLAYVSTTRGNPFLIIYPSSNDRNPGNSLDKPNLWESEWAIAHEYGHHVLQEHANIAKYLSKKYSDNASRISSNLIYSYEKTASNGFNLRMSSRQASLSNHLRVVNEAFADLFAYYSLGSRAELTRNLPCLKQNRDLASAFFHGDIKKILDSKVLQTYYSTEIEKVSDCNVPNFQGEHAVGAIVAYGLNLVFQHSQVAMRNNENLGNFLLAWADRVKAMLDSGRSNINLDEFISQAIAVASRDTYLTGKQCEIIKDIFPEWAKLWLGLDASSMTRKFQCESF